MPTQLTIPVRPQYGIGQYEPLHAHNGLAGLRWSWESSFGQLLPTLGEAFTGLPGAGGIVLFPPPPGASNIFNVAGDQTLANIGAGLTNTQHAAAVHHVQESFLFDGFATAIKNAAEAQLHTKKHVEHKTRPRVIIRYVKPTIRANLKPLATQTRAAMKEAKLAERQNAKLRKRVAKLEHEVAHLRAIAIPVPAPFPRPRPIPRPRGIPVGRKLGKLLGLAAFLGLLAEALKKMGVNSIRCRNNKRWTKHLCGLDPSILENLIADTFLVVGSISLIEFAHGMQTITGDVAYGVNKFWNAPAKTLSRWDDFVTQATSLIPGP